MWASTRSAIRDTRSVWASIGLRCCVTTSTTSACISRTTCASCSSSRKAAVMRISLAWLQDWVDVRLAPRQLADRLTMAGFEVEAIDAAAPPLDGVVVGQVASCEPHPNADTL